MRLPRRLVRAIATAGSSYGRDFCPQMAAAISYHVLFSLFPLAICFVSIFGLVLQNDARRDQVVSWLIDNLPLSDAAGASLDEAISGLATPLSLAGLVALVGLLWSASGMMAAIRTALTAVWSPDGRRPYVRGKLLDLVLVVLAGVLVLVAFGVTMVVQVVKRVSEDAASELDPLSAVVSAAGALTEFMIPVAIIFVTILLLYHFVPPGRPRFADIWPAALLASIALQAATTLYGFYLSKFADYNVVYGSLGAVIGFLFLVYLAASIFLFGAELAVAWPRAAEPVEASGEKLSLVPRLTRAVRRLVVHDEPRENDGDRSSDQR